MGKAQFCKQCGRGFVSVHECPADMILAKLLKERSVFDANVNPIEPVFIGVDMAEPGSDRTVVQEVIPPAWQAVAKIFTQELCEDECEWCQSTPDPYNTGDHGYVQSECIVPTPRQCPAFEDYVKEHS